METLSVRTPRRECLIDISQEVARRAAVVACAEGICTVFVPHTTAGVTINENADPDVSQDVITFLNEPVPRKGRFRHAEGNSDAHIKASLMGSSVQVPIHQGRLALGTWQGIYLAEFDGPRDRSATITCVGDATG